MKMVLHYLKFDLRRSWWLIPVMWLLAALYVWTISSISAMPVPDFQSGWMLLSSLSDHVHVIALTAAYLGCALCYLAGAADSRNWTLSWTLTRPVRRRSLYSARALLIACAFVLPVLLAHTGALTAMAFSTSTVITESIRIGLLVAVAATSVFLIGWFGKNPAGIFGAGLAGLTMVLLILAARSLSFYSAGHGTASLQKAEMWPAGRLPGDSDDPLTLVCPDPAGARGLNVTTYYLKAYSWRASATDNWSPWIDSGSVSETSVYRGPGVSHEWSFDLRPLIPHAGGLKNGEVKLGLALRLKGERPEIIPITAASGYADRHWNLITAAVDTDAAGYRATALVRWTSKMRGHVSEIDLLAVSDNGYTSVRYQGSRQDDFPLPAMGITYYDWRGLPPPYHKPAPTHLRIWRQPPVDLVHKVLHFTGITLPAPVTAPVPQSISVPAQPALPRTLNWESLSMMPQPLFQGRAPEIPLAGAERVEVAAYLMHLTTALWDPALGPWDRPETKRPELVALVLQWLPMFLQATVAGGELWGAALEAPLLEGTPEDRRAELIRRIPESPLLARIAIRRGWLSEAKPEFLELFRKAGGIPELLKPFLTQFRDPEFHPLLRAQFRASVPLIRFWRSRPELAAELPGLLAAARSRIQSLNGNPDGWPWDEIGGLLSTGEAAALDLTLHAFLHNPSPSTGWPREWLLRWLRTAEDRALPQEDAALKEFLRSATSADFTWNAARGLFLQKSTPATP